MFLCTVQKSFYLYIIKLQSINIYDSGDQLIPSYYNQSLLYLQYNQSSGSQIYGSQEYGFGYWARWCRTGPIYYYTRSTISQVSRIALNYQTSTDGQNQNETYLGVQISGASYVFQTQSQNTGTIQTCRLDMGVDMDTQWNYIYFSYNLQNNSYGQAVAQMYWNLSSFINCSIDAIQYAITSQLLFSMRNEYSNDMFNGYFYKIQLNVGTGAQLSYDDFKNQVQYIIPLPIGFQFNQTPVDPIQVIGDEIQTSSSTQALQAFQYSSITQGYRQYSISGWVKSTVAVTDWTSIAKLSDKYLQETTNYQNPGDRTLAIWFNVGFIAICTYNLTDKWYIDNNYYISYNNLNLSQWIYMYYGYSRNLNSISFFGNICDQNISSITSQIYHFIPTQLTLQLQHDGFTTNLGGYMKQWYLNLGDGSYLTSFNSNIFLNQNLFIQQFNKCNYPPCTQVQIYASIFNNSINYNCTPGYFYDGQNIICQKCDSQCYLCANYSNNSCSKLQCISQYLYYTAALNTCQIQCNTGYYNYQYNCLPCDPSCQTCINSSNQSCISCFINGTYPNYNSQLQTCSLLCANGYYLSNNDCLPCDQSCLTCQNQSTNSCLSCSNTSNYPYYYSKHGICSSNCTIGYYNDHFNCLPCDPSCYTCTNSSNQSCMSCLINGSYPYYNLKLQTCSMYCINGYYKINNYCMPCDITCLTCQNQNSNSCISCLKISNYPYYTQSLGICSSNCTNGYYNLNFNCLSCDPSCYMCINSSNQSCISCFINGSHPNYNVKLQTCSMQCVDGYYQSNNYCLPCDITCFTCQNQSTNSCTSCSNTSNYPYYYSNLGICSSNCTIGYYNDHFYCLLCDSSCYTCTNSSNQSCTSCYNNGQYPNFNSLYNQCYPTCPQGYFDYNTICQRCSDFFIGCIICDFQGCQLCDNVRNFFSSNLSCICKKNYILVDYTCELARIIKINQQTSQLKIYQQDIIYNCENGYYYQNQSCLACNPLCITCQNEYNCDTCKYMKMDGQCLLCQTINLSQYDFSCQQKCGDNLIFYQLEECDDGNNQNGDGQIIFNQYFIISNNRCSNICKIENKIYFSYEINQLYNGVQDRLRQIFLIFNDQYQLSEGWLVTLNDLNNTNLPLNQLNDTFYLIEFNFSQTSLNPILKIQSPNSTNLMVSPQYQQIKLPPYEAVTITQTIVGQSSQQITQWLIFIIILTSVLGISFGGLDLIIDTLDILQNLSYYFFFNIQMPYVFTFVSNELAVFNISQLFQYQFQIYNYPGVQQRNILGLVPEKFDQQGYVGSFIVNLLGISSALIVPISLNFASKQYIKLYYRYLIDFNENKFKIALQYINKLSEKYYRNFYNTGQLQIWLSISINVNFYIFLQLKGGCKDLLFNVLSQILAFIFLVLQIKFLQKCTLVIQQNKNYQSDKKILYKFITDGLKLDNYQQKMNKIFIEYKKILFAFTMVFLYNNPIFQCTLISFQSMIFLAKIIQNKPYLRKIDTIKQIVLSSSQLICELLFTILAINQNLRVYKIFDIQYENIIGYILILFCLMCLLVFSIANIMINIKYYTQVYKKYQSKQEEVKKEQLNKVQKIKIHPESMKQQAEESMKQQAEEQYLYDLNNIYLLIRHIQQLYIGGAQNVNL